MGGQAINREHLLQMGQVGDVFQFVNLATTMIALHPDDSDLRILLVRRLIEFGLFHRASKVAEGFPLSTQREAGFSDLFSKLNLTRNNGLADWSLFTARYEANLAVIRRQYEWADAVDEMRQRLIHDLELHKTHTGHWQVFDRAFDQIGAWRPSFGIHCSKESLDELRVKVENQILPPIVIDGVGLADTLSLYYEATEKTLNGASPILYQIETDLLAVAVILHLYDWRQVISDERVIFCIGPRAYEQFERKIEERRWTMPPKSLISSFPWNPQFAGRTNAILDKADTQFQTKCMKLRPKLEHIYADRDPAYWRDRFASALSGKGKPLRILSITSRFTTVLQYSTRDALRALSSSGCETRLLIEPDDHSYVTPDITLETIREFEPDLILMIDHTRQSQIDSMISNIPVVTWVQDRLHWLFNETTGRSMGPLDFCMGIGAEELIEQFAYPADRFMPCQMATNFNLLTTKNGPTENNRDNDYDCDVAFATHASETPSEFYQQYRRLLSNQSLRKLTGALYDEIRAKSERCVLNGALYFDHIVRLIGRSCGYEVDSKTRSRLIAEFVKPLTERFLRHQTIEWAVNWANRNGRRLHLYGDGWEHHPVFGKFARGTIEHGPDLGRAFRSATINLHAGCNTAFHQRVLDGLAAGGFFLIRRHAYDIGHRVSQAIYNYVRKNNFKLHTISWNDLPPSLRDEFIELQKMKGIDPFAPVELTKKRITNLRTRHEIQNAMLPSGLWPEFDEITFGSESELCDRLDYYLCHPETRKAVATSMRKQVIATFDYEGLMSRLLVWLTDKLGNSPISTNSAQSAVIDRQKKAMLSCTTPIKTHC